MGTLAKFPRLLVTLLVGFLACNYAQAQATRTWVSGVGDDANPCSRTAPCKTFAGAISKTATEGVIDVLDPGGFGALTITKSITVENVGEVGGVLVSGTNGFQISAPGGVVVLRGLTFEGLGSGLSGINFLQGSELLVERCDIDDFVTAGINFTPNSAATLIVRDSTIHNNGHSGALSTSGGILINPATGGSVNAVLDNVRIVNSVGFGIQAQGQASVTVRNSVIGTNSGYGVSALGVTAATNLMLDHIAISGNSQGGILAEGSTALVRISDSTVTDNTLGIRTLSGGAVTSFGNNRILGNVVNGAPSASSPLQ
jgi:Right handed beta helix region